MHRKVCSEIIDEKFQTIFPNSITFAGFQKLFHNFMPFPGHSCNIEKRHIEQN